MKSLLKSGIVGDIYISLHAPLHAHHFCWFPYAAQWFLRGQKRRQVLNATAICLTFAVFLFGLVVSQEPREKRERWMAGSVSGFCLWKIVGQHGVLSVFKSQFLFNGVLCVFLMVLMSLYWIAFNGCLRSFLLVLNGLVLAFKATRWSISKKYKDRRMHQLFRKNIKI